MFIGKYLNGIVGGYSAMSHNVEGVEGQDNFYGSLTNSLIFPNAMPFPPMPPQGWQGPIGWQQNNGTADNGFTNFYQGRVVGAAPNYMYNESEPLTYDEGDEDFYENQQQWEPHGEAVDEQHSVIISLTGKVHFENANAMQGVQEFHSEAVTPSSRGTPTVSQANARVDLPDTRKENQKPTDKNGKYGATVVPSDRAAELRAKLLAKRSANGTPPVPELTSKKEIRGTEHDIASATNGNKPEPKSKSNPEAGKGGVGVPAKPYGTEKASEHFNRRDSESDIEGLFAEARAVVEAQKIAGHRDKKALNGGEKSDISAAKESQFRPETTRQASLNNSVKSLEASEQGEIREDNDNSGEARQRSETEKPKQSEPTEKVVNRETLRQSTASVSEDAQRKKYIVTDLANGVGGRPSLTSARREGSISSRNASADFQSQSSTTIQRSREDRLTHAERSSRRDRHLHVSPKDSEQERERKATEYKRELESRRQRFAGARAAPDQDVEDLGRSRQTTVSDSKVTESRPNKKETHFAQEPTAEDSSEDREDWLQMTGYYDLVYRRRVLDRNRKFLALETQKAELEREAQLEYEERAQFARAQSVLPRESIERDLSRVQYSPKSIRIASVTTMPPPPIPIKQNHESVGLMIKDLAPGESPSSERRIENVRRPVKHVDTLSPVQASTLKRHHVSDDREIEEHRPADKLVRLDMNGRGMRRRDNEQERYPVRASSVSLERRMTLDDSEWSHNDLREHIPGNKEIDRHARQVRGRPVSPYARVDRQRLRSLSPMPRRTSGQDTYMTDGHYSDDFNADRVSPSPQQPILSRNSSPPRRTQGIRYDEYQDEPPMRRYYEEKIKAEPKYRSAEYQDYFPGRPYDDHRNVSSRGRGGFRGRWGYQSGRGGYKHFKREEENEGNSFQSQSLDLRAGGQYRR